MTPPFLLLLPLALLVAGCGSRYSADEYASSAVQQANPVQRGTVVGARRVAIAAEGAAGAAAGAAAGGVVGGATATGRVGSALGAVGGALVGGLVGTAAERASANTDAVEYVIQRADKDELVSVTQRDAVPIPVGTRVLVIAGAQARVVPDYLEVRPTATAPAAAPAASPAPVTATPLSAPTEVPVAISPVVPSPVAVPPPPVVPAPPSPG
ncbi:hypothetical protein [Sabulicella glaciei]|uniref:Glycine zipper 2TM domain-containing protein n=1 Tax=Sabulicella glaciei TaxID=2984948 RepID=A0ABT3NUK5_9PROT|nr:hypothetical protein [Roseococcus sp. MDT2-1-1]MCW8085844.1 hypothetical protein [Roseococcus sp. MDT2-1-1]